MRGRKPPGASRIVQMPSARGIGALPLSPIASAAVSMAGPTLSTTACPRRGLFPCVRIVYSLHPRPLRHATSHDSLFVRLLPYAEMDQRSVKSALCNLGMVSSRAHAPLPHFAAACARPYRAMRRFTVAHSAPAEPLPPPGTTCAQPMTSLRRFATPSRDANTVLSSTEMPCRTMKCAFLRRGMPIAAGPAR